MKVARKVRPDASDLGGDVYQVIGRTFRSFSSSTVASAFLPVGVFLIADRYLFKKPRNTKAGEYLLRLFFSLMMLLCASIRATGSLQTLWENYFQVVKAPVSLVGIFPLCLFAIRGLNELLQRKFAAYPLSCLG